MGHGLLPTQPFLLGTHHQVVVSSFNAPAITQHPLTPFGQLYQVLLITSSSIPVIAYLPQKHEE